MGFYRNPPTRTTWLQMLPFTLETEVSAVTKDRTWSLWTSSLILPFICWEFRLNTWVKMLLKTSSQMTNMSVWLRKICFLIYSCIQFSNLLPKVFRTDIFTDIIVQALSIIHLSFITNAQQSFLTVLVPVLQGEWFL